MSDEMIFPPSDAVVKNALIDDAGYQKMYADSIADPDAFWGEQVSASIGSNLIPKLKMSPMMPRI